MLKAMMIRAALDCWNALDLEAAAGAVLPCCGSRAWAMELARRRPLEDERGLLAASDEIWRGLAEADWRGVGAVARLVDRRAERGHGCRGE